MESISKYNLSYIIFKFYLTDSRNKNYNNFLNKYCIFVNKIKKYF